MSYLSKLTNRLTEYPPARGDSLLSEEIRRRATAIDSGSRERRRILVVGGAGYIGTILIGELLARGFEVVSIDQLLYENSALATIHWNDPGYMFRRIDLRDGNAVNAVTKDVSDVVILAALVGDPISKRYPQESQAINVDGLKTLLEGLNRHPINKVIFVSTCSNYGLQPEGIPATETSTLNPLSIYARNKVEVEAFLQSRAWEFAPTILRFATAFGLSPRMRFDLTINEFTRDLFLGKELLVYDPDTWRPYCHVLDFARAILRVLDYPRAAVAGQIFNTGGEKNNHTKRSIVETVTRFIPDAKVRYKEHGTDPRNYRVDFTKISVALDFQPKCSAEDGVTELLSALRAGVFDDADLRPNFYGNRLIAQFQPRAAS